MESGKTSGAEAEKVVLNSLKPLLDAGADTIVLGCTHYPFLSETISKVASGLYPERLIRIIDPAPAVARHLKEVMQEEGLLPSSDALPAGRPNAASGTTILHSSGDTTTLEEFFKSI